MHEYRERTVPNGFMRSALHTWDVSDWRDGSKGYMTGLVQEYTKLLASRRKHGLPLGKGSFLPLRSLLHPGRGSIRLSAPFLFTRTKGTLHHYLRPPMGQSPLYHHKGMRLLPGSTPMLYFI